ncbi:MAG TPA: hypothetical protein PKB03_09950, partial [Baekduia sp.]|nr:hypothetical protein [Baekduia sp.]
MTLLAMPAQAGAAAGTVELKPGAPVQAGTFGAASGIAVGRTIKDGIRLGNGVRLGASTVRGSSPSGKLKVGAGNRRVSVGSSKGPQWVFGTVPQGLRLTLLHNGVRQQRLRVLAPRDVRLVKQRSGDVVVISAGVELGRLSAVVPGRREQSVVLSASGSDLVMRFSAKANRRSAASVLFTDAALERNGGCQFPRCHAGSARGAVRSGRVVVTPSAASWLPWVKGSWTWSAPGDAQLTKASGARASGKALKRAAVSAELVGSAKVLRSRALKANPVGLAAKNAKQLRLNVLTVGPRTATAEFVLPKLTVTDARPPSVESAVPRSPWMQPGDATLDVLATDSGTGVREILISGAVNARLTRPCASDDSVACPVRWDASIPLTGLGSGTHSVDVLVSDRSGRTATRRGVQFGVDPSPAVTDVSVEGGKWTSRDAASVKVTATDPQSGVRQIRAALGAQALGSEGQAEHTFTAALGRLPEGLHGGEVVATNGAGAEARTSFEIGVDRTAPELKFSGALEGASPLVAKPLDSPVAATDKTSGLARLELKVDGRPLDGGGKLDPRALEAGEHELVAVATDKAGNEASGKATFRTEYVPPTPLSKSKTTDLASSSEFLYRGDAAPQKGLTEKIEPTRIAVIRGRVAGPDGKPMGGVTVRVADHPE